MEVRKNMKNKIIIKGLLIGIIILFIGVSIGPSVISKEGKRVSSVTRILTTWIVDDEGDGDFTSIQEALDNSSVQDGDTIEVYSGFYYENVHINKKLTINGIETEFPPNGNDTGKPLIEGNGVGNVVTIVTSNVIFSNFSISNSGNKENESGIFVSSGSKNNKISSNNISFNNATGIIITRSSYNEIHHNIITNNGLDGIGLRTFCNNNKIYNNIIENNGIDGLFLVVSSHNVINDNSISYNANGVNLYFFSNLNTVHSNNISYNTPDPRWPDLTGSGVFIYFYSCFNTIKFNTDIYNNTFGVRLRLGGNFNIFTFNNFIDNQNNTYFINCIKNKWRENYYDDWIGLEDPSKEKWPYVIKGNYGPLPWFNFDLLPLKNPFIPPS